MHSSWENTKHRNMKPQERKAKILIVDDEKINLDVLVELLKPYYKTVAAQEFACVLPDTDGLVL